MTILTDHINPEVFNDEVAIMTSWESLSKDASNVNSYALYSVNESLLHYKSTANTIIGFICLYFFAFLLSSPGCMFLVDIICTVLGFSFLGQIGTTFFGDIQIKILFMLAGFIPFLFFPNIFESIKELFPSISFDKMNNSFTKGEGDEKISIQLSEIHAIQLLSKTLIHHDVDDLYYYELNIVLKDGSRNNVVDYYSHRSALDDSLLISQFLNVKVWDACTVRIPALD